MPRKGDQRQTFGGRNQFAALTMNVTVVNQAFDNCRARGRRAETFLAHGFTQFLVFTSLPAPSIAESSVASVKRARFVSFWQLRCRELWQVRSAKSHHRLFALLFEAASRP